MYEISLGMVIAKVLSEKPPTTRLRAVVSRGK